MRAGGLAETASAWAEPRAGAAAGAVGVAAVRTCAPAAAAGGDMSAGDTEPLSEVSSVSVWPPAVLFERQRAVSVVEREVA